MTTTPTGDGCPALPGLHPAKACRYQASDMTLCDWFAGQALAGMAAHPNSMKGTKQETSGDAYAVADAMIAEKRRREGGR